MDHNIELYQNEFYLHFPAKRPQLIGFGQQTKGKLGTGKNSGEVSFISVPLSIKIQVKEVFARKNFSVVRKRNMILYYFSIDTRSD